VTLSLDDRRRAMLQEMGVRFLPPARREQAPAVDADTAGAEPWQDAAPVPAARVAEAASAVATRALGDRPPGVSGLGWEELEAAVAGCRACGLCERRRQPVFGVGPVQADWMVVGEAPGEQEDLQGEPFVGPAGQLLDQMLRAIGRDRRRDVYIANVLKCRPPGNRNPEPQEVAQCEPFLRRQVELLRPRMILAMGRFAVQSLLQSQEPIGRLRGRVHRYGGVPVVVTYHPAYLLRNLPDKAKAWEDLCLAMQCAEEAG